MIKTLADIQETLDNEGEVDCPLCPSSDIEAMGTLGIRLYMKCRACGWQFSRKVKL